MQHAMEVAREFAHAHADPEACPFTIMVDFMQQERGFELCMQTAHSFIITWLCHLTQVMALFLKPCATVMAVMQDTAAMAFISYCMYRSI